MQTELSQNKRAKTGSILAKGETKKGSKEKEMVGKDTMDICTGGVSFAGLTTLALLLVCG